MLLSNCKNKIERIIWYTNASIGYLHRFKSGLGENELGKAEHCIKRINELMEK